MSSILDPSYFKVKKNGITPFETMVAYLGGSAFQTVVDNPVTAYRQLVQQYAKDLKGNTVDPKVARLEANAVFKANPISASLSGLGPRLVGVGFKRIPKFGSLLAISYFLGEGGEVGMAAATGASILSAPFINPIRMIEKQQRAYFKQPEHKNYGNFEGECGETVQASLPWNSATDGLLWQAQPPVLLVSRLQKYIKRRAKIALERYNGLDCLLW